MTRKMAWIGSFYLIGLFFASFSDRFVNFAAAAALSAIAAVTAAVCGGKRVKITVCALSAASGILLYNFYDIAVYERIISYGGTEIEFSGVITGCSEYGGDSSSYTVKGKINGADNAVIMLYADSSFADAGDKVSFRGTAEVMKDSYAFPTQSYYKAKGIYLRVYDASELTFSDGGFSVRGAANRYRDHILDVIRDEMGSDCSAIMSAMLFGDKSAVDSTEKTLMYRAGIGHIMAVSGVHLSVVCSFFWFFLSRLPIGKYARFGLFLIPVGCFVLLAGMSNSVMRAAVMVTLVYGAGLFRRRSDTFSSLGIAMIVLTAFSPFAVRDASFLLSAAGVFGIGVAAPALIEEIGKKRKLGTAARSVIASLCVTAIVFPAAILFFDEVSVISPISNLLLLPVCEVALIGGMLVTLTGGAAFIAVPTLKVCGICCKLLIFVSEFLGSLRFSYIPLGSSFARYAAAAAVSAAAVSFVLYKQKKRAVFFAAAVLTAAIAFINVYRLIPDGKVTVAVLKEGSAVTAVVHDKKTACVIDLRKGGKAAGSTVKYLNRNGIYRIEVVVLNDSVNTSLPVYAEKMKLFDVDSVFVPLEDSALTAGFSARKLSYYLRDGSSMETECCRLDFLPDGAVSVCCCGSELMMYGYDPETGGASASCFEGYASDMAGRLDISENVKFTVRMDGSITSGIIK